MMMTKKHPQNPTGNKKNDNDDKKKRTNRWRHAFLPSKPGVWGLHEVVVVVVEGLVDLAGHVLGTLAR